VLLFPSDRTRMPLNHAEMITSRTPTCRWVGFFLEILNANFASLEIVSSCTWWLLIWLLWLLFPEVRKMSVIQYNFELSFSEPILLADYLCLYMQRVLWQVSLIPFVLVQSYTDKPCKLPLILVDSSVISCGFTSNVKGIFY